MGWSTRDDWASAEALPSPIVTHNPAAASRAMVRTGASVRQRYLTSRMISSNAMMTTVVLITIVSEPPARTRPLTAGCWAS